MFFGPVAFDSFDIFNDSDSDLKEEIVWEWQRETETRYWERDSVRERDEDEREIEGNWRDGREVYGLEA